MVSDECHPNPINTLNLCKHKIPRKFYCYLCVDEIEVRKELKIIKEKMNEIENILNNLIKFYC